MRYSTKFSDSVHILAFICVYKDQDLSSTAIAKSVKTNPSYVRQIMSALRKGNLLNSVHGHAKPELAKSPNEITLFNIYKAIEGDKPLLHLDTHTNPECFLGCNIQKILDGYYKQIQDVAEDKMKHIFLSDILKSISSVESADTFKLPDFWSVS